MESFFVTSNQIINFFVQGMWLFIVLYCVIVFSVRNPDPHPLTPASIAISRPPFEKYEPLECFPLVMRT